MTIAEMERRCQELKDRFSSGIITEEEFRSGMAELRFQDSYKRWWMIGVQSGKWYVFDGTRWLPGKPPEMPSGVPTLPEISPTRASTSAASEPEANRIPPRQSSHERNPEALEREGARDELQLDTNTRPVPAAFSNKPPESLTTVIRRRNLPQDHAAVPSIRRDTRRQSPRTSFLVGFGVITAIILLIVLWLGIDNFVPGKPISAFLGRTLGSRPPTPAASQAVAPANIPSAIAPMIAQGDQLVLHSQLDNAIKQYQSASRTDASSAVPLTRWSRALAFRGQIQDALSKARQAVKLAPNDAEANAQLSRALAWSGQVDEAITVGENTIKLDPKNANAHAFLAEAYLHARRPSDARTQAQTALQLAPQSAEAHRALAWVFTLSGQKDTATAEWRQATNLEPNLFFRHYEMAEVERVFFKATADAVSAYQQSLSLYGSYVPAIMGLGMALLDANRPQEAIAQFKRVIAIDPNNEEGIVYLGLAFQKTNQCSQAIPYFEQALKVDANNSVAQRGLYECKSGKSSSALASTPPPVPLVPPTLVPGNQ